MTTRIAPSDTASSLRRPRGRHRRRTPRGRSPVRERAGPGPLRGAAIAGWIPGRPATAPPRRLPGGQGAPAGSPGARGTGDFRPANAAGRL